MRRMLTLAFSSTLAMLGLPICSQAAFTIYTNQASFLTAAGSSVVTENFDEITGTPRGFDNSPVFVGVTFFGNAGWSLLGQISAAFPPVSPPNSLVANSTVVSLWLGGGNSNAFGFNMNIAPTAPANVYPAIYALTVYESNGNVTTLRETFPTAGSYYIGFVESSPSAGISEVTITPIPSPTSIGAFFNINLDDVSRSAITPGDFALQGPLVVPETASAVLLGIGLAGMAGVASFCRLGNSTAQGT